VKDVSMIFNTVDANGTITGTVKADLGVGHQAKPTTIKFAVAPSNSNASLFELTWTDAKTLQNNLAQLLTDNPST
jgi:hypothetical protein